MIIMLVGFDTFVTEYCLLKTLKIRPTYVRSNSVKSNSVKSNSVATNGQLNEYHIKAIELGMVVGCDFNTF